MTKKQAIQLFEERKVRTAWDDDTLEKQLGRTVISSGKASDHILPRNSAEEIEPLETGGSDT